MPFAHANAGPQGVGLQRPLVVSHVRPAPHEVLVQRATHIVPPKGPALQGLVVATQTLSGAQPASPEHWLSGGPPTPPHG